MFHAFACVCSAFISVFCYLSITHERNEIRSCVCSAFTPLFCCVQNDEINNQFSFLFNFLLILDLVLHQREDEWKGERKGEGEEA